MSLITVEQLPTESSGINTVNQGETAIRRRLMEMGVLLGSELTLVKWASQGDPA